VDSKDVNNLPLNGRNFTFLAQLSAGVNTPQSDTRGNAASGAFTANGNRPSMNNYLLDGIDNNSDTVDFLNGTNYVVLPPIDAIQEFKVQSTDFSAEFGRSGAAVVNASIKSGTNELHGAAWEFFRNDKMDAADFFENAGDIPKGALRQNQFGFTAGGPVVIRTSSMARTSFSSSGTMKDSAGSRVRFSLVRSRRSPSAPAASMALTLIFRISSAAIGKLQRTFWAVSSLLVPSWTQQPRDR